MTPQKRQEVTAIHKMFSSTGCKRKRRESSPGITLYLPYPTIRTGTITYILLKIKLMFREVKWLIQLVYERV